MNFVLLDSAEVVRGGTGGCCGYVCGSSGSTKGFYTEGWLLDPGFKRLVR